MVRFAPVAAGVPRHFTQRGNRRQPAFLCDAPNSARARASPATVLRLVRVRSIRSADRRAVSRTQSRPQRAPSATANSVPPRGLSADLPSFPVAVSSFTFDHAKPRSAHLTPQCDSSFDGDIRCQIIYGDDMVIDRGDFERVCAAFCGLSTGEGLCGRRLGQAGHFSLNATGSNGKCDTNQQAWWHHSGVCATTISQRCLAISR